MKIYRINKHCVKQLVIKYVLVFLYNTVCQGQMGGWVIKIKCWKYYYITYTFIYITYNKNTLNCVFK